MNDEQKIQKDKNEFLSWMKTLTDKQFVELFYEATAERNTSEMSKEVAEGHFVLANVEVWKENEEIQIEFIGLDYSKEDFFDADYPICQSGTCQKCKNKIRSWAKNILCPICGNKGYGT